MNEEEFIAWYTVEGHKVTAEDVIPTESWTCFLLTYSAIIIVVSFSLGFIIGTFF